MREMPRTLGGKHCPGVHLPAVVRKCSDRGMPWDFWLILGFMAVVLPWRGRVRLQRLLALPAMNAKDRISLYAATIGFQWILAGVVLWRCLERHLTIQELGLIGKPASLVVAVGLGGAALLGFLHWFNLRRIGKMEGAAPEFLRRIAERILPRTQIEFPPFFALAITAGICEEFLYRGFAVAALHRAGIPGWGVVLITAILFGLAHTYQGPSGVAGTSVLGLVFGAVRIATGTLAPLIIWHATIDAVAGVAGSKFLLHPQNQQQPDSYQ